MTDDDLKSDVARVRAELEASRGHLAPQIEAGLRHGHALRDAARGVADASSGSWVGWHARMYFGDFEEPSARDTWDSEWGGLQQQAPGWRDRTQSEVQQAIEDRAGATLADLASQADAVRTACEPLQQELLTVLSPVCDLAGLARESEMLAEIEKTEWIVPAGNFVRALAPNGMMSRDSGAINQGMQAPLHLNVEAAIVQNMGTITASRDFLDNAIRLTRQVETKLRATPPSPRTTGAPGKAAVPADDSIARQLRRRSLALFVVLALIAVAAAAAALIYFEIGRLIEAVVIVGVALAVGLLFALLVSRKHAWRVLGIAAAVGSAVAVADQLLASLGKK